MSFYHISIQLGDNLTANLVVLVFKPSVSVMHLKDLFQDLVLKKSVGI